MPKCTINGVELEVKAGTTIIEAMTQNKQRIAHYCWHPGLTVAGVCRLCMVEIEGNPRLQIACNTVVTEGMKINNTSAKVKDAAKWGLDFHLINHPLDCPICDQAGECGLQEQYMEFGKYTPEMSESKVKKHKVVDLGPTIVLDSERCILCSRCVRFCDEVPKTSELGIFNRGDRSEIGTVEGKKLNNKYSVNTVDICPVGALTSKDFRFRQRVWYLKDSQTVCNGCSAGCNVKMYYNKEGFFRVKPVYNEKVNGHWMCDEGRDVYKYINKEFRNLTAQKKVNGAWVDMDATLASKELSGKLKGDSVAVVLTGQYTNEEFDAFLTMVTKTIGTKNVFHYFNNKEKSEEFDGILLRGDRNPNTKGLLAALTKFGIKTNWSDFEKGSFKTVIVAGPENKNYFPDLNEKIKLAAKASQVIWLQSTKCAELNILPEGSMIIPMKSYTEKSGTFVNHAGIAQTFKKVTSVVPGALGLDQFAALVTGQDLQVQPEKNLFVEAERPQDTVMLEHRKKNEFVFKRGSL
jgi:NADH-quinone oxidoreductase subunit G